MDVANALLPMSQIEFYTTMEDINPGGNNRNANGSGPAAPDSNGLNGSRTNYSIPGILHFVQHEWARFEMERAHWEVERAELQVFL